MNLTEFGRALVFLFEHFFLFKIIFSDFLFILFDKLILKYKQNTNQTVTFIE